MPSNRSEEIEETWKKMPTDPALVAVAIKYYNDNGDELTQKLIAWLAIYTDEEMNYRKKLHKRQFELLHKPIKISATVAEKQALAEFADDKMQVDKSKCIYRIFSQIQKRLDAKRWD